MSGHRSKQILGALLLFVAAADAICWSCMPKDLPEEEIDRILAEEFKEKLMQKLGMEKEPVVPENWTYPPQEILDELYSGENEVTHQENNGDSLQAVVLQPLNTGKAMLQILFGFETCN